jgi:Flp pilus assembly protein TadD
VAAVRVIGIIVALVVCAWFGIGIRQAHETNAAASIVSEQGRPSASQIKRVSALLGSAGTLNPDSQLDVLRGRLAVREGSRSAAERVFKDVVRREPMNADAWYLLANAATDAHTAILAAGRLAQLDPKVPGAP